MNPTKNRFATVLILIIILAVCVQAHPNGGDDSFDNNMDLPWDLIGNVGEQFADALAYNRFNTQMAPSRPGNSRSVTSPPHHARPQTQSHLQPSQVPSINYSSDYFSFPNMELAGLMETQQSTSNPLSAPILTFVHDQHLATNNGNNTAISQWDYQRGIQEERLETEAGRYQSAFGSAPAPANAANMYGYPHAPQVQHQQWPTQPQASHSPPQHGMPVYAGSQFDMNDHPSMPMDDQLNIQSSQPVGTVPNILPAEVTSNPNYQSETVPSAPGNMLGWIRRAPAIGERTLPSRLDTDLLAPPEAASANRSPTSASTTGSSTRGGSRRQRWEMTGGDFICHWCNAGFATQGDLTHHLRSHQSYSSRQHVCHHCQKRFQYRKDLNRHLPKHDPNRKKYYCIFPGCKYHNKGFGRQDHLDRHIQTQHRIDTPQQSSRPSSNHASQ